MEPTMINLKVTAAAMALVLPLVLPGASFAQERTLRGGAPAAVGGGGGGAPARAFVGGGSARQFSGGVSRPTFSAGGVASGLRYSGGYGGGGRFSPPPPRGGFSPRARCRAGGCGGPP